MKRVDRLGLLAALAALTLQLGCDSPTGSGNHAPASVVITSGEAQTAVAGSELPQPLVVRVADADGDPVAGAAVSFAVAGGGSVTPASAVTDAQGQASAHWTLGTSTADSQTVAIQVKDAAGAVLATATAHATAQAGTPAAVAPFGNSTFTGMAGIGLLDSVAVKVTDAHGNPVPGTAVVWTVISGGGGVSPPTATTNAAGIAKGAWTLGTRVDSAQVLDAAAGLTLRTHFTAVANASGAYTEETSGDAQTDTAGKQLPQPLVVTVRLSDGRPVRGATVTWSPSAGTVSAPTSITDSLGRASVTWTLGSTPGGQTVTATAAGFPVTFTANALQAPLAALVKISGDGRYADPGEVLPLVVKAADIYGNPVAGVPVSWAVTAGGGNVAPASANTGADGLAQAAWTLGAGPYPQKVTASTPGVTPVTFSADTSSLSLAIVNPSEGAVVGNAILVMANVNSRVGALVRVFASMDGSSAELTHRQLAPNQGLLDISASPVGIRTLTVTAIASNGDTARATRTVYHEPPPQLQVSLPAGTVARGGAVQVDVTCTGVTPCDSIQIRRASEGTPVAHGSGSLSALVNVSAYEGKRIGIEVLAFGPHGVRAEVDRSVFVESTPHWTELASGGSRMHDIDATRILYIDSLDAAGPAIKVRARAGGAESTIYRLPARNEPSGTILGGAAGYLHSQGAIFRSKSGTSGSEEETLFDWRGGTPAVLGSSINAAYLTVAGDWAAYGGAGTILRFRNLAAGTQQELGGNQSAWYDVAANGDLVWMSTVGDQRVFRLRGGTSTVVSAAGDSGAAPVTDGTVVAYGDCGKTCRVAVVAADGSVSYPTPGLRRPSLRTNIVLTVEGGWVAWIDDQFVPGLWTRAPDGTVRKAVTGPTSITLLTPTGDGFYTQGGRWYVVQAPYTAPAVDVGAALGRLVFRPGIGVVALEGRSAFRVDY
jgi:hypothetical protein